MTERHSKAIFSTEELRCIIALVRELERASSSKQKGIRDKLRKIGLHWSEVTPSGTRTPYTVANLQKLFEDGTLRVEGLNTGETPAEKTDASTMPSEVEDGAKISGMMRQSMLAKGRKASDESYVIDLCDEILGCKALRQYRFDFLKGDAGTKLPVDAYYPELNMVVEYYESQHTQATPFFDNKQTVSGVSRGEQRKKYDRLRQIVLPEHGIKLVIISYTDFGTSKHLKRNHDHDLKVIKDILMKSGCDL